MSRYELYLNIILEMCERLEKTTGKKVDLMTYNSLSPYLKKEILSEEIKVIWQNIKICRMLSTF